MTEMLQPPEVIASAESSDEYPRGASRIWTDVDLDAEGKSFGYFRLPYSTHEHGGSWVPIPVANIKNGTGPRVLLMAGNHGDEFEGQVLLMKFMRLIEAQDVCGQIIVLSAANAPAAYVGRRVSPLDNGNLNRSFPGSPNGSPTQLIAHFIESVLLRRVDRVFDFHTGGSSAYFTPSAHIFYTPNKERFEQQLHLLKVFGMPTSIVVKGLMGNDQKLFGACERAGVPHMSTELGGGGGISIDALRCAEEGVLRVLFEVGVIRRPLTTVPAPPTRLLTRLPTRKYVYAPATGLFEPYVEVGAEVSSGDAAGAIHFPEAPWREPELVHFTEGGTILCVRPQAQTSLGDLLFILGVPWHSP